MDTAGSVSRIYKRYRFSFSVPKAEARTRERLIYSAAALALSLSVTRDPSSRRVQTCSNDDEARVGMPWTIHAYWDSKLTDRPPSSGEQNAARSSFLENGGSPQSRMAASGRPRRFLFTMHDRRAALMADTLRTFAAISTVTNIPCRGAKLPS